MVKAQPLFFVLLLTCLGLADVRLNGHKAAIASDAETTTVQDQTTPIEETLETPAQEIPTEPNNIPPITEPEPAPAVVETRLILKLKERRVYIYQGDKQIAMYPVAVGKKGWETPTGNFTVLQMISNPVWQNPWNGKIVPAGPKNPLGERWIGFWTDGKNYIGFHGTAAENLIGQAVSHGCVRMRNSDIKAIFDQIKVGTQVTVVP